MCVQTFLEILLLDVGITIYCSLSLKKIRSKDIADDYFVL
jgi:hypothetical protein